MSQHDYIISDADGATFLADLNDAFAAAASTNKGTGRPSPASAGQLWVDENTPSATVWTLYLYDGTDDIALGTFDTSANAFTPAGIPLTYDGILCPHKNLVNAYGSVTAVSASASEVVLFDASGNAKKYASLSESVALTASGANGLDTGSEATSTWYHLWAIGKDDGTLDALLSASATSPTLPSGYAYKGYLGAAYNDSSGDLVPFHQRGKDVTAREKQVLAAGTATSYTAISLAAAVPPTATSADLTIATGQSSGTGTVATLVAPAGSGPAATYGEHIVALALGVNGTIYGHARVALSTAQEVKYRVSGTNARGDVYVEGYSF